MQLRLGHKLSLLLVATTLVTVLALGSVLAWNLRTGFSDYLEAREAYRLEQFAGLVAERVGRAGGAAALEQGGLDMRALQDEFALREGRGSGARPDAPPAPAEDAPPPFGPPPGAEPPGAPPPRGAPPETPGPAPVPITVYGQDGAVVLGRPLPAGAPYVERPIILRGRIIGSARMPRVKPAPDAVEARFLRQQYAGIAGIAAVLVLLATLTAWRVSGRWVRPLLAVQQATARIARGELDVRLADAGADEIGDVVRNINRMTEGLQRLESARRRWIAEISHELRTPLAVLRGEIEALIDGVRTMQAGSMVSLREEVLRLSALIEDLHLLAMSDLRTLPCHAVEADAVDIARQVVGRFERRAARQGLALTLELGGAASAPVRWDPQRIEQVLGNLIENSLRYTDAPGRVVLTLRAQRQRVTIDVEDTAPGVPPADLERLFEPLYRADSARDRAIGGSGLGLAICNAIVRAHGGAIEAVGSALGGVHIHIDLPATAAVNA